MGCVVSEFSLKSRKKRKEKGRDNTGKSPSQLTQPSENAWWDSMREQPLVGQELKLEKEEKKLRMKPSPERRTTRGNAVIGMSGWSLFSQSLPFRCSRFKVSVTPAAGVVGAPEGSRCRGLWLHTSVARRFSRDCPGVVGRMQCKNCHRNTAVNCLP